MTRKDYEALAKVMRESRPEYGGPELESWKGIVSGMIAMMEDMYPNFNSYRFLAAVMK